MLGYAVRQCVRGSVSKSRRVKLGNSAVHGLEPLEGRRLLSVANPSGGELLVNTTTVENQLVSSRSHSAAMDASGNSVLVWQSFGNDGAGWGIFARRYNAAGAPQGPEFRVNDVTANDQTLPAVAMDAAGNFVVGWRDVGRDGSAGGIYARRFSAAGVAQGSDFQVNLTTAGEQSYPVVGMAPGGDTVIAWESAAQDGNGLGVYARRFNASGAPAGGEFRANTYTTSDQFGPSVAVGNDGRFVIAWESLGQDGDMEGIYAQRFDPAGAPQGGEFHVSTATFSRQRHPVLDYDAAGNFVVAWSSNRQDPSSTGIFSQRYNAAGQPAGAEYRVNVTTYQAQIYPDLAMDDAGNYVVAWVSDLQDGSNVGIYARQYDAAGAPTTGEVRVNTYTTGEQTYPSVAMDAAGDFIATWQSRDQDGAGWGVYAQRYVVGPPNTAPTAVSAQTITVNQGAADTQVSLWNSFSDPETADSALAYSVVSNANPAVTTAINTATGTLTLHYLSGASGTGDVVVRATDAGGLTADLTLHVTVVAAPVPPPVAPSALSATAASARRIDLAWADNSSNESGFRVERSPNGTSGWAMLTTTAAGATSYADTTVAGSTTYFYRVSATNSGGTSSPTAVASATTPVDLSVVRSFRADDPAVVWGGAYAATTTVAGRAARGLSSQYVEWTAVVNGTSASISAYPVLADALSITVDGVTTVPTMTPEVWQNVPLFSGLSDGPHTVTVRNRTSRFQAYVDMNNMVSATGSNPGVSLRPGYSQNIYAAATSAGIQRDGTMTPVTYNGNPNSLQGVDSSMRIRTRASAIKLWMNFGTDRVRLSIDGVEQQSTSVILPDGPNNNAAGLGGMAWYDFATGLDTSREHEYRLWFEGTGFSQDWSFVSQIMLVGGTLNTATPPAPALPMLVGYGDSITFANAVSTAHDSGVGYVHRIGSARNMATLNLGVSGSTVHNFGVAGATGTNSGVARTGQVPAGASDVFVLYGYNDAFSGVDAATFRTDYGGMISAIRARAPGARIYCVGLLPTTNGTVSARRPAFNAEIANTVATSGDANIVYVGTDSIGFDPRTGVHTYDGSHPNAAGYALLAPYFQSFMLSGSQVPQPPAAPSNAAAANSATQVTVTWADNSNNETGFKVERSPNGTSDWGLLATTAPGATSYVDPTVAASSTYYYRVAATNAAGDSAYAATSPVTTPAPTDTTAPTATGWAVNAAGTAITATLSETGVTPASGTAGFTLANTTRTVTGWSIGGTTLTLTLSGPVYQGEANPAVSYSAAAGNIRDAAGNPLASFSGTAATNNSATPSPAPINDAPVAADDSATTPAGVAVTVTVLANDTDSDGDALSVTSVTTPSNGTATLNANGTITYTPVAGFNGFDQFTYAVSDGHGGSATATVRLAVGNVPNTAPVIGSASTNAGEVGNVAEGQAVNVTAAFSDAPVDTHTATIDWGDGSVTAAAVNQSARTAAGSHAYTAGGAYAVTLTVTDDKGAPAIRQVMVYVTGEGVQNGVLHVIGTKADERVYVVMANAQIRVTAPFNPNFHRYFDTAGITRVFMMLGDGNDSGSIYPDVPVTGIIDGGAGNDALAAGTRSLVIGGPGVDSVTGSAAADVLVGGTTVYDGKPSLLSQVLDGALGLNSGNVFSDNDVDTFIGGAATDQFWGNFSGAGVLDTLGQALQAGEALSDLP